MKTIKLKRLIIKDWRSINLDVKFSDSETTIRGRNGIGKSSIFHAWSWLLTSYTDTDNPKNTNLFDATREITPDTPEASVEAFVSIDGFEYRLKKTAQPSFIRDRESGELYKSNTDKYKTFIDGLNVSATEFNNWVTDNLCKIAMLPFCVDGLYFADLSISDRQKARGVLDNIVGEITDDDFKDDYTLLKEAVGRYSVEDFKKVRKSAIKDMEDEKKKLTIQISTAQENIKRNLGYIEDKKAEIADVERQLKELSDTTDVSETLSAIRDELGMLTDELLDKTNTKEREVAAALEEIDVELREIAIKNSRIEEDNNLLRYNRMAANDNIAKLEQELERWETRAESYKKLCGEIKMKMFDGEVCAVCGQKLPAEEIEKARKAFNAKKSEDLENAKKSGRECMDCVNDIKDKLKEQRDLLASYPKTIEPISTESLENKKEEIKSSYVIFEFTKEGRDLVNKIEEKKAELEKIRSSKVSPIEGKRTELIEKLSTLSKELGVLEGVTPEEIAKWEEERRNLSNKIASYHKDLFFCEKWLNERADIISARVNTQLNGFNIEMWSELKNGDRTADCVVMDAHGVPYATLNTAHRIKACIEIQKMFCKYYGIQMPIFIDEAAVFDSTNLPHNDSQTIYLMADDSNVLIVE